MGFTRRDAVGSSALLAGSPVFFDAVTQTAPSAHRPAKKSNAPGPAKLAKLASPLCSQ